MIIIIDGYNLIKHIDPEREITERERSTFLHMISQYARRKKHKIIVIFDGGPYEWPYKERVASVKVIYSGRKQTADDVIMHYIADHKRQDLLLVSSDHELNLFASKHDAVSIGSQDFYYLLQQALAQKTIKQNDEIEVVFDEQETDLDTIMEQASEHVLQKEPDAKPSRVREASASRFSKEDRELFKKLKKL